MSLPPVMGKMADVTYEKVYVRSRHRLALLAAWYVGADADDLVHEAFLRAFRAHVTFRNRAQTTTWLHRIVVNACLDHCRQQQRSADGRCRQCLTRSRRRGRHRPLTLRQAIRPLSPEDRQSYLLHDVLGYTHREVETRWAISAGTSKGRVWRARRTSASKCRRPPATHSATPRAQAVADRQSCKAEVKRMPSASTRTLYLLRRDAWVIAIATSIRP